MTYNKICPICGKEFKTDYHKVKYCSRECRLEVDRRKGREKKNQKCTIEKTCAHCGKKFLTYSDKIRFCNKSCSALARPVQYGRPPVEKPKEMVSIMITRHLEGVYEKMQPVVGAVYVAEKPESKYQTYIIRSIGKYGLLVRGNECVQV